jgi:hypothetical protein
VRGKAGVIGPAPLCAGCGRPLQRSLDRCVYCGRRLTKKDRERIAEALDDETVRRQVESADAVLMMGVEGRLSGIAKVAARATIIALSLAAVVLFSWVSEWNPWVIGLSLAFFSLPVWRIWRR